MDISEDIIRRGTSALANNTVFDLYNSSYHTQYYPIIANTVFSYFYTYFIQCSNKLLLKLFLQTMFFFVFSNNE